MATSKKDAARKYGEFVPGIYVGMTNDEYFSIDAVNNSFLGDIKKCPANACVVREETNGMRMGKAVHLLFLEGADAYNSGVVLIEGATRNTKAYKEAVIAEENEGKILLLEHEGNEVKNIVEALYAHPKTAGFWKDHVSVETAVLWIDPVCGLPCKAKIDKVLNNGLLDLKTTADHETFVRYALKGGYFRQAAFYLRGYNLAVDRKPKLEDFYFAVVSTKPPYQTEYYRVDPEGLAHGAEEAEVLLALASDCREWGLYPHYTGDGMIKTLSLPGWVKYDINDDTEEE